MESRRGGVKEEGGTKKRGPRREVEPVNGRTKEEGGVKKGGQ